MSDNRYGNNVVQELADAVLLGYGAAVECESMGYIGGQTGGQLWLRVYAATDISIDGTEYWYIEFESYSSDSVGSMIAPFSVDNSGGINQATGTVETNAHMYLLCKTSSDSTLAFSKGDLITEMAIPEKLCRLLEHDYVNVRNITDKSAASERIDILLCINPS